MSVNVYFCSNAILLNITHVNNVQLIVCCFSS